MFDFGREALKVVAIATMTVDHAGNILFPEYIFLRYIGRLAFPLFCYLIILGIGSTRSMKNYFIRLIVFALVSQVPYFLAFEFSPFEQLNILFTLSFGLLLIYFYNKNPLMIFLPFVAAFSLNSEGGLYGLAFIGCMGILNENTELGILALFLLNIPSLYSANIQILSLLAIPLVVLHKHGLLKVEKKVKGDSFYFSWMKYFFYVYYPIHLTLFYVLRAQGI